MRNKKIIAFICALSMIISLFAGFTVVSAETTTGIKLDIQQDSPTVAKVIATYEGFENGINSAKVKISVPKDIKEITFTKPAESKGVQYTENKEALADGSYLVSLGMGDDIQLDNNLLTEITITLNEGMSKDFDIKLLSGAVISSKNPKVKLTVADDEAKSNMTVTSTTMTADPDKKEEEVIDAPTVNEDNVVKPEKKDEVTVPETGGIVLTTEKVSDTAYKVVAKYTGFDNGINSAKVKITVPKDAKEITFTKPAESKGVQYTENKEAVATDGTYLVSLGMGGDIQLDDKLLTEITVTYPDEGYTDDFVCELADGAVISSKDPKVKLTAGDANPEKALAKAWTTLPASKKIDNEKEEALKDVAKVDGDGVTEKLTAAEDATSAYFVAVPEFTDATATGTPKYGEDYVAYYDGVKVENEDTLNALLQGKVDGISLADVADKLTFKYNSGKVKINTQFVVDDAVASSGSTTTTTPSDPGNDPGNQGGPTLPTLTVPTNYSVTAGAGEQVYTVTVTEGSYAKGTLDVYATLDSFKAITGGIVINYTDATTNTAATPVILTMTNLHENIGASSDGQYKISFTPAVAGKVELGFIYNYIDTDNNNAAKTIGTATTTTNSDGTTTTTYDKSFTVTINAASNQGGGNGNGNGNGSSGSSGGGVIASGNLSSGTAGGAIPGLFSDLADASWAATAVSALAGKNIVSGYEDGTFRPNGNITRAEYAQILINAIGKQGESADTYFNDVPTDAWFYHNVAVAAQYGIVSGYGDGNFGPYDLITREQMALMTLKAAQVMSVSLVGAAVPAFSDDAAIADWSRDAVYTLANAGIINGMGDGTFAPKANATRAQAATIIYNTFVK